MSTTRDETFGCEIWNGPRDAKGYARQGRALAYVAAWEREFGPVPEGFVLDHNCKVRHCVALHHLEAVTQSQNLIRRSLRGQSRRTHCQKGHDLSTNRVVTPAGGFVCRTCNREAKGQSR